MWAWERCRISPPRFLAECRLKRLSHASFVLLNFASFVFSGLRLVFVLSVLLICLLSCIFPVALVTYTVLLEMLNHARSINQPVFSSVAACTDMNGTVYPNCADVPLRIC